MAEAQKKTETITVTRVHLTLTEEEARTLRAILGHVSGDEQLSPRKHADAITKALNGAGFSSPTGTSEGRLIAKFDDYGRGMQGVRFANYGNAAYGTRRMWGSI